MPWKQTTAHPTIATFIGVGCQCLLLLLLLLGSHRQVIANPNRAPFLSFKILPHHAVANRRLNELKSTSSKQHHPDANVSIPTLHNIYQGFGTHYIDIWMGTPIPQRQTVIIDTGSSKTAFPCTTGCKTDNSTEFCGESYHTDYLFDPSQSNTFRNLTCEECYSGKCKHSKNAAEDDYCQVYSSYSEGTEWTAVEATDWMYVGVSNEMERIELSPGYNGEEDAGVVKSEILFGCQDYLTGFFITQLADGIMGMSKKGRTFWRQLYKSKVIQQKQFSLCFIRQDTATFNGTEAGVMTLGGVDERLLDPTVPMVYAEELATDGWFNVYLNGIYLQYNSSKDVNPNMFDANATSSSSSSSTMSHIKLDISPEKLNHGGVILDSGTTSTYMTKNLHDPFIQAFRQITGFDYTENYNMNFTSEEYESLPTILFQLRANKDENDDHLNNGNGKGLAADLDPNFPSDVIVEITPRNYMVYEHTTDSYMPSISLDESSSTLGANFMAGYNVLHDIDNDRIGFAKSHCDYDRFYEEANKNDEPSSSDKKKEEPSSEDNETYDQEQQQDDVDEGVHSSSYDVKDHATTSITSAATISEQESSLPITSTSPNHALSCTSDTCRSIFGLLGLLAVLGQAIGIYRYFFSSSSRRSSVSDVEFTALSTVDPEGEEEGLKVV